MTDKILRRVNILLEQQIIVARGLKNIKFKRFERHRQYFCFKI